MTSTLTFGLTKISVLFLYKRQARGLKGGQSVLLTVTPRIFRGPLFTIAVWSMIVVVVVWTVAFFLCNMLQCYPISENWTALGGSENTCINENMMYLGQAFSDAITDGKTWRVLKQGLLAADEE